MFERDDFLKWISVQVEEGKQYGGIARIELVQGKGASRARMAMFNAPDGTEIDGVWCRDTSTQLKDSAIRHCKVMGGRHKFTVMVYFREETEPLKYSFDEFAETELDDLASGDDAESPMLARQTIENKTVAQMSRHTDAMFKSSWGVVSHVINTQTQMIDRLQESLYKRDLQIERAMGKTIEMVSMIEDLHSKRHDRELASAEQLTRQELNKEIGEKAISIGSVIANRVMKKYFGSGDTNIIKDPFLDSLTPTQFESLMESATLSPEQKVMLAEMMKTQQEIQEKRKTNKVVDDDKKVVDGEFKPL
jgi:hypothetical protein